MSEFISKGWYYLPKIITKEEAIQIKYKNLMGAIEILED